MDMLGCFFFKKKVQPLLDFFTNADLALLQLIVAAATLFLAAKSEETPCPLNKFLHASSEILHKQEFNFLSYFPVVSIFEIITTLFFFLFCIYFIEDYLKNGKRLNLYEFVYGYIHVVMKIVMNNHVKCH